jgi:hypothetical protein
MPPTGRFEVGQAARAGFDPVLRPAIAGDIEITVGSVQHLEHSGRIDLGSAGSRQGVEGMVAEADIGQHGLGGGDDQGQVVERRAGSFRGQDPPGEQSDVEAESREQCPKETVELVAEAATAAVDDLVEQR